MVTITDLDGLLEFLATAEAESFSAAAKKLNVSVAHISRMISALERRLGVQLFHRTTRKVALTDKGRSFFRQSQPLITELSLIQNQMQDSHSEYEGLIRISSAGKFSEKIISPIIAKFGLLHSKVKFELHYSDRNVDLISENFDIAIRAGRIDDSLSLVAKRIKTFKLATLASPKVAKKFKHIENLKELDLKQCMSHSKRDWFFRIKGKQIRLEPLGSIRSNNAEALINSAIAGNGIVQVPEYYGTEAIGNGQLISLFEDWQEPDGMTFHLVYEKQKFQSRRVKALIDYILETVSRE